MENGSSGIRNLDYKALLFQLEFKLPPIEKLEMFDNIVKPIFFKINKNKYQILTLIRLRDNLLPKLMSGDVRVEIDY